MRPPLADATVIEVNAPDAPVCLRLAASLATKIAADLGARVLKLEPAAGDCVRAMPPRLPHGPAAERSALFQFLNTGKATIRLPADAAARGRAVETLLSGKIDAVVAEEGEPSLALLRRRGLGLVEIAGFPATVPPPHPRLSEFTVLALGGLLDMVGEPEREPLRLGGHQGAYPAGLAAFTALTAMLAAKDRGLAVEPARVSLIETMLWVNWKAVSGAKADGRAPTRQGARSEFQVLPCRDGWIAVVFTVTQFDALRRLVGPSPLDDAKFDDRAGRIRHVRAMYEILAPWFAARGREEIYAAAQEAGVPLGPAYTPHDLLDDPQYLARDFIAAMPHAELGALRLPRLPVLWNDRGFPPRPVAAGALP